jgi:recombinational DNA repair protein RecR
MTMYPDTEEQSKIAALKNVLSSFYEHVRTCKICHTYLEAILEHAVKREAQHLRL